MGLELEKPRVTELQLRMDCNGCVHKIRKTMLGVDGVYDINIDFAQQKLTVIGRAELDKILRAIKKTKKIATVCSHTDPNAPPEPAPHTEPAAETPAAKPAEEPPKEPPPPPPQEINQAPDQVKPSEEAKDITAPAEPKVIEEIHMVHHYPYNRNYNSQHESSPRHYVYQWSPVMKNQYSWGEAYDQDYYHSRRTGDCNKVTSMFSEENPNNCTIM